MAAHEKASLWSLARGQLPREEAERVSAHIALCGDCAQALREVRAAQAVLVEPPVPELEERRWRLVDAEVMEAARRELARPRWRVALVDLWRGVPGPAWVGAVAAAAVVAAVLFWPVPPAPVHEPFAQSPSPSRPAPLPPPVAPTPAQAPKHVTVASARHARSGGAPLLASASLAEGAQVTTDKQGELWLSLPDGSRAGLLGGGEVRLERVSAQDVRLHVERGTLLVAAAHRAERPFTVRAGEVEVHVVGTRFLVERDDQGVNVAVEDGAVDADLGGARRRILAGESVRFARGSPSAHRLDDTQRVELARLEPSRSRSAAAVEGVAPDSDSGTPPIPAADSTPPLLVAAAEPVAVAVDSGEASASVPVPPLVTAADSVPVDAGPRSTGKRAAAPWPPIKLPLHIDTPIPPVNITADEHHVRQIVNLADLDDCVLAVERADQWLQAADGGASPLLRRKVLFTKARCLRKLGREDEARAVERQR